MTSVTAGPLRLHDTLSGTTRPFEARGSEVTLYVCGVTPYDTAHLGHAFTYVAFDVLIRYLRHLGLPVRYVQNVTDLDDPLFERARTLGVSPFELAREQTERHLTDMVALNVLPADVYPHASREIGPMIDMVEDLLERGRAYSVDGRVYFDIATDGGYGKLSRYDRATMIELARERGGDPDDPRRRDPLDFLLWRPSAADEPKQSSPWGPGLPGWHLECSAMSLKYLGAPIDIHGGGADLIFPHHESEIAQSEGATGSEPFVRYWMHTGMVRMDGEKMSKSLGNMVFVRDLMRDHGSDAVRLLISGTHYREELSYEPALMEEAAALSRRLTQAASCSVEGTGAPLDPAPYRQRFFDRMNDDLDTPGAIDALRELADAVERADGDARDASTALREMGEILGLRLEA